MEDGGDDGFKSPPENANDIDDTIRLLARQDRRDLVGFFRGRGPETATVDELVEHLLERRQQRGFEPNPERVEIELYHVHLPRLAEHGIVEYDPRNEEVRYRAHERIEALLDRLHE